MKAFIEKILKAKSIVLSTHREPDGDGLGSELAMYHALKKIGKSVRILNVDKTPRKYNFLQPDKYLQCFESPHEELKATELSIILDTNDFRLIMPLYEELQKKCKQILFLDHHPILKAGPFPTTDSWIDVQAASCGEMAYNIIQSMGIKLDPQIARCLYTSISFDTQIFRFIRNAPTSHLIASELLKYERKPEEVHQALFGSYTVEKIAFISKILNEIEYYHNKRIAYLKIDEKELDKHSLHIDETRDLIDMIMAIEQLEAAIFVRANTDGTFKFSFRSKGRIEILSIAEQLGGGGHIFAAGCPHSGNLKDVKELIISQISEKLKALEKERKVSE